MAPVFFYIDCESEHIVFRETILIGTEVAVGIGGIAHTGSKPPLFVGLGIIVVYTADGLAHFARLIVVVDHCIRLSAVGIWQTAGEVFIAR